MNDAQRTSIQWTKERAAFLAVFCLLAGIAAGWLIRGSQGGAITASAKAVAVAAPAANDAPPASAPGPAPSKEMAATLAAPLLQQLQSNPGNPELLANIGNIYYDAQQYPTAVHYYARALRTKPADASVRTDMGTAYWYMGNPDAAIAEFDKALTYAPDNPNTLFNLGLVKWKGKMDSAAAIADWKKLLAANPNYDGKEKVRQLIAEATKTAAPGRQ
jgi:tetratricopeptide (TPR) repeat protein